MNRYFKVALIIGGILAILFITRIWLLDVSDPITQKRVEFTLAFGELICSASIVILTTIGLRVEKKKDIVVKIQNENNEINKNALSLDESIYQYLSNLESYLEQYSIARPTFVQLSTQTRQKNSLQDIELLQSFLWLKRKWQGSNLSEVNIPINVLKAHEMFRNYILLGEPGSGKTTCMQYLVSDLILKYREKSSDILPIYISLSDWEDRRTSAIEFLRSRIKRIVDPTNYLVKEFENLLSQGKFLVILDGLNEMPNRYYEKAEEGNIESRKLLLQITSGNLLHFHQDPRERSLMELASAEAVRSKFIITCREHEFYKSPSWQEIRVLPMNAEQINSFVHNYIEDDSAIEFEKVLRENKALLELAANPFFLKNMIGIYSIELEGITNRGQFLEYLLEKSLMREKQLGKNFDLNRVKESICKISYSMMKKGQIGSQVNLKSVNHKHQEAMNIFLGTGLLVSRDNGHIFFYHQLIQEFMAALAIRENWARINLGSLLSNKKWVEVIILWYDISRRDHILPKLLRALYQRNKPWNKPIPFSLGVGIFSFIMASIYTLIGVNVIVDLFSNNPFIIPKLKLYPILSMFYLIVLPLIIRYIFLFYAYNPEAISNSAYILGKIRNPIAIDNIILAFTRVGFSRTKLAESLSLFGKQAIPNLIMGLSSTNYSIKKGCVEALSLIGDNQAINPLLELLGQNDPEMLFVMVSSLNKFKDPRIDQGVVEALRQNQGGCSNLLGMVKAPDIFENNNEFDSNTLKSLEDLARNSQLPMNRNFGIEALGKYGHYEGANILINIINDNEELDNYKNKAIESLALIKDAKVIGMLLNIYEQSENNTSLQDTALYALSNIKYADAVPELYKTLEHKDEYIRSATVRSLGLIGDNNSISHLKSIATIDNSHIVRKNVAKALGGFVDNQAVELLRFLCGDSEHDVREIALKCLDLNFPDTSKDIYLKLATDASYPERIMVVEILGQYRFSDVRGVLLKLCADVDVNVRRQAAESLQRIDLTLTDELKYVSLPKSRSVLNSLFVFLAGRFHYDEYSRLADELRFEGETGWLLPAMASRITKDSELKRKLGYISGVFYTGSYVAFVIFPIFLAVIFNRSILFLGGYLTSHMNYMYGVFVGLSIILFLPFIQNAIDPHKQIKMIVISLRVPGILIGLVLFIYVIILNWIITLSVLLFVIIIGWKLRDRFTSFLNKSILKRQKTLKKSF
ncbi:MAG: HEAT repeat domain-containing protein [Chloroflexota bacterium]